MVEVMFALIPIKALTSSRPVLAPENVEIARRWFFAFNRSVAEGTDDYHALLSRDVEWIPITALLDGRTYRGPEGVRRWVDEMKRDWRVYETRWTEARDLGDGRVLAFGVWDSLGRVGGVELSFDQAAWLMELRGGKMIRLQAFADRSEALEAAGLVEQAMSRESVELAGPVCEAGQIVELRDGTRALIRPIGPWDRKRLNEGFESASAESIFLRFLAPQSRLSSSQLDYLTAIDHIRHEALIAIDPETGQSFGTARYIRSDDHPETAEFAVGVGDRWMRIGLGTALLRTLVLRAREAGVIRFIGLIHADNTAIRRLLEKVAGPYETRSAGHGAMEVAVDL